eukprot:2842783-Prymnesium_polylepis.3
MQPKAGGKRGAPPAAEPAKKAKTAPPAAKPKAAAMPASTGKKGAAPVSTPKSAAAPSAATPASGPNTWSDAEDSKLKKALSKFGPETSGRWEKIAAEARHSHARMRMRMRMHVQMRIRMHPIWRNSQVPIALQVSTRIKDQCKKRSKAMGKS